MDEMHENTSIMTPQIALSHAPLTMSDNMYTQDLHITLHNPIHEISTSSCYKFV